MLITVLNDGTLITVAYDNVNPSKQPDKWNLKALWWAATVCVVACVGPRAVRCCWQAPSRPRPPRTHHPRRAVSVVLSAVALLSSLILLWAAVDSGNPGSLFSRMGACVCG